MEVGGGSKAGGPRIWHFSRGQTLSPAEGKRREGPAHAAGHISAPREHQVFITGIPMKRLQVKNHTQEEIKTTQ